MFMCATIISSFFRIRPLSETTILRIPQLKILLLAWAESTVAEFSSDSHTVFTKWAEPIRPGAIPTPESESKDNSGVRIVWS